MAKARRSKLLMNTLGSQSILEFLISFRTSIRAKRLSTQTCLFYWNKDAKISIPQSLFLIPTPSSPATLVQGKEYLYILFPIIKEKGKLHFKCAMREKRMDTMLNYLTTPNSSPNIASLSLRHVQENVC